MSSSRAVGFLMPSGAHFLLAGSSSSFPKRLHSPSNSKVVSTCLGAVASNASSLSSSLNSVFSVSVSLPTPLAVPLPAWSLVPRSAGVSPVKTVSGIVEVNVSEGKEMRQTCFLLFLLSHLFLGSIFGTLVWGGRCWSGSRGIAPGHTSTSHSRTGNGTLLVPMEEEKQFFF